MIKWAFLWLAVLSGCESDSDGGCDGPSCIDAGPDDAGRPLPKCLGPGSGLGDPCVCQTDCGNTALCLSELQNGYPRGICLEQGDGGVIGLPTCDATNACRIGWLCSIIPPGPEGKCLPHCAADSDCPSSGHCDLYAGLCRPERDGDGFSEVCQSNEECKSDDCNPVASGYGLCRSYCNASRGICPEDGVCEPNGSVEGDEFGRCWPP